MFKFFRFLTIQIKLMWSGSHLQSCTNSNITKNTLNLICAALLEAIDRFVGLVTGSGAIPSPPQYYVNNSWVTGFKGLHIMLFYQKDESCRYMIIELWRYTDENMNTDIQMNSSHRPEKCSLTQVIPQIQIMRFEYFFLFSQIVLLVY